MCQHADERGDSNRVVTSSILASDPGGFRAMTGKMEAADKSAATVSYYVNCMGVE